MLVLAGTVRRLPHVVEANAWANSLPISFIKGELAEPLTVIEVDLLEEIGNIGGVGVTLSVGGDALDGSNGFNVMTKGVGMQSGYTVAAVGDFNGDGFDDVVIGAPYKFGEYNREGAAFVVFGSDTGIGSNVDVSALDGADGFTFTAYGNTLARLGYSLSNAGDVNGDGFDDLIIGTQWSDYSYVVFGVGASGASLDASALDGTNGFMMNGWESQGISVSGGGDINGDGFDDLLVGTDGSGVFVVFGAADMTHIADLDSGYGITNDLWALNSTWGGDGTHGFHIVPADGLYSYGGAGSRVAAAGDLNGDGFDDIIIGAPHESPNGVSNAGAVYVVFGGPDFDGTFELASLDGINGFRVTGATQNGELGMAVAGAGDLNGDGFDDFIVGERAGSGEGGGYGEGSGGAAPSAAYVIYGRDNGLAGTVPQNAAGDNVIEDTDTGTRAVVRAGAGDDTIEIPNAEFFRIDGGGGTDTLVVTGADVSLDFSSLDANAVEEIEIIDLGAGNNSISVTPRQAAAITGTGNVLQIDGTVGTVTLLEGADAESTADGYTTYSYGGTDIRVAAALDVTLINVAPYFVSGSNVTVAENETHLGISAADDNGDTITYSIVGGDDAAKFGIDPTTGLPRFNEAPDFENPTDAYSYTDDGVKVNRDSGFFEILGIEEDNVYEVTVGITDGTESRTQDLRVSVIDVNDAPYFLAGTDTFSIPEEASTTAGTVAAADDEDDEITYSITGGADADSFLIDAVTGQLTFKVLPDFESPGDEGVDNVYEVTVSASDLEGATNSQSVQVTVTDVNVAPVISPVVVRPYRKPGEPDRGSPDRGERRRWG